MDKYAQNKASPFGSNPLVEVDQQTYGDAPDNGAVLAKRLPIMSISPDLRQPRRVVPHAVRGAWDGDPYDFLSVLGDWHLLVEEKLGHSIDLPALLKGEDEIGLLDAASDPVVAEYGATIKLAQTILADGQRESIEVWRRDPAGKRFVIQDGERRWVAHQLLHLHVSGDFATILATEKDRNVWAQATRNGAHRALNAIAMARQIALLLIAMYEGDSGINFDSFESMVLPGECDRKYYAQVARGDLYPVKRGMLARVLSVTGLKTRASLSQYRSLLDLDDETWLEADAANWALNGILESRRPAKPETGTLNAFNTSGAGEGDTEAITSSYAHPIPAVQPGTMIATSGATGVIALNDLVLTDIGSVEKVIRFQSGGALLQSATGYQRWVATDELTRITDETPLTAEQTATLKRLRGDKDVEHPAVLLTPAERDALDRAWGVMHRADPRFKGWYPAPPHPTDAIKRLLERGFLEATRRSLWGAAEESCLRITHEGCRALGRVWIDADSGVAVQSAPDYGDLPRAKPIKYPIGVFVYHMRIERVGLVRGNYVSSTRTPNGTVNTEYVTVQVLGWGSSEISWAEADVRGASNDEVAFWTKGASDAPGTTTQRANEVHQGERVAFAQGTPESEPVRAAGDAVETGAGRAAGKMDEKETALFADWASLEHTGLGEALRLLHALTDDATKTRINDLLTMTYDQLHGLVEVRPIGDPLGLNSWLATSESRITELVGRAILKPLNDYVLHLKALGKEIDADVRG